MADTIPSLVQDLPIAGAINDNDQVPIGQGPKALKRTSVADLRRALAPSSAEIGAVADDLAVVRQVGADLAQGGGSEIRAAAIAAGTVTDAVEAAIAERVAVTAMTGVVTAARDAAVNASAAGAATLAGVQAVASDVDIALERVETIANTGVGRVFEEWAVARDAGGWQAGDGAIVMQMDAGTHADPTNGQIVPNSGVYRYVAGVGLKRIAGVPAVDVANDRAAVELAAATVGRRLTPLMTAPIPGSGLERLGAGKFRLRAKNGAPITVPENLVVRELARDVVNRFRFRMGVHNVDTDEVVVVAAETTGPQTYDFCTGYVGERPWPLYVRGAEGAAAFGVPADTELELWPIDWEAGGPFGVYGALIPPAEGRLNRARILPTETERSNIVAIADDIVPSVVFLDSVNDSYLANLVLDISIERGMPGRRYVLNYRTDRAGATRRMGWYLYDPVIGKDVAYREIQKNYDWSSEVPECVYLFAGSDGTPLADYTGIGVTIWLRPGAVEWTHPKTTRTTIEAGGILASKVKCAAEIDWMIEIGMARRILTVGATKGQFPTIEAAQRTLLTAPTMPRAGFPFSDVATPSNQYKIVVVEPHIEERPEQVVDQGGGVLAGQGLLLWAGVILELRADTIYYTRGSLARGGPLIEASFGGKITGRGRLGQLGYGYVLHLDAGGNRLAKPATVGPPIQHWYPVFDCDGPFIYAGPDQSGWIVGMGATDGQKVRFRNGAVWRNGTNAVAYIGLHTSANSVNPGEIVLENMRFNDASVAGSGGALQLVTIDGHVVKHVVKVKGCDAGYVSANALGESAAFMRQGQFDGVAYDPILDAVR
ncbi:MAG: hypothetical protein V4537_16055 [Pseudomonadota bacterium]